ncbi:transposase [Flammeovirga pectinis]|uniref:Transposase n=1 Tax=Flammeovirga pectinis TaxID=2494373 RepID=A0A3Q9FRV1_9BACT|nr:transposase [Flammeovirga pectinis]AZQ63303.1 transposase [Flammeovirga pectinis]
MRKKRTAYDKEFKQMVVNLHKTGKSIQEVGRELELNTNMVARWIREEEKYGENSFQGNGKPVMTDLEYENARLRKALKEAEEEREILKKAVSIFSRSDNRNTNL